MDEIDEKSRQALIASVDETLSLVGGKFKQTILHQISRRSSLTIEDVVEKYPEFMSSVRELIGNGAVDVLEGHIAKRFYDRLGLVFVRTEGRELMEYVDEAKRQLRDRGSDNTVGKVSA